MKQPEDLRASAGSGLIWGAGFTLGRDILQFAAMLVMVRLLSPEIYGVQALAQTIIGMLAVLSLKTFAQFALQARDPESFDWDAHFTAGAVVNFAAFLLCAATGAALFALGAGAYATAGLVVVFLSPIFLLEIAGTYRLTWLQARHRWKRMRLLLLSGSLLGVSIGVLLALAGAGPFALASTNLGFSIPLVVDFFLTKEGRPRLAPSLLAGYGGGIEFGVNRLLSAAVAAGRTLGETAALSAFTGFAALGAFNRAVGLAQLTSGRIGPVTMEMLYPVLTRAEAASERFNRFASLLVQGVAWVSLPAAAFLALERHSVVALLYGHAWVTVAPMLPLACAILMLRSLSVTVYQVSLANLQTATCLKSDIAAAITGIAALAALPFGILAYLWVLLIRDAGLLLLNIGFAHAGRAIKVATLAGRVAPAFAAAVLAGTLMLLAPQPAAASAHFTHLLVALTARGAAYGLAYLVLLRLLAPKAMAALLDALPLRPNMRSAVARLLATPQASS